jgi:hypothetical protein
VPSRRRIDPVAGQAALAAWARDPDGTSTEVVATAVRFSLEELTIRHPGHAVEVRVPPYGATQCLAGVRHTRGTPPNVIETDPITWLNLVTGKLTWVEALAGGRCSASGNAADLSVVLPLQP